MGTMPPANADFETCWAYVEGGLNEMMTRDDTKQTISSYDKSMIIYTVIYNIITMSVRTTANNTDANRVVSGAARLYERISFYFADYVKKLAQHAATLHGDVLLQYYAKEWDFYHERVNHVNRLFAILNRRFVLNLRTEGVKGVYPIYTLALVRWQTAFVVLPDLSTPLIRLVERERMEESIDVELVEKILGSFVAIGLDDSDLNKVSYEFFDAYFRDPFLDATSKFYERAHVDFLEHHTLVEYLGWAQRRLEDEMSHVERYGKDTADRSIELCRQTLIRDSMPAILGRFDELRGDASATRLLDVLMNSLTDPQDPQREELERRARDVGLLA